MFLCPLQQGAASNRLMHNCTNRVMLARCLFWRTPPTTALASMRWRHSMQTPIAWCAADDVTGAHPHVTYAGSAAAWRCFVPILRHMSLAPCRSTMGMHRSAHFHACHAISCSADCRWTQPQSRSRPCGIQPSCSVRALQRWWCCLTSHSPTQRSASSKPSMLAGRRRMDSPQLLQAVLASRSLLPGRSQGLWILLRQMQQI